MGLDLLFSHFSGWIQEFLDSLVCCQYRLLSYQSCSRTKSSREGQELRFLSPLQFSSHWGAVLLQCYSSSSQGWGNQKVLVPHTHTKSIKTLRRPRPCNARGTRPDDDDDGRSDEKAIAGALCTWEGAQKPGHGIKVLFKDTTDR